MKYLLVLLVAAVVYSLWKNRAGSVRRAPPPGGGPSVAPSRARPAEVMIACEHCGLHVPAGEAIVQSGHTFCSREHAHSGVHR